MLFPGWRLCLRRGVLVSLVAVAWVSLVTVYCARGTGMSVGVASTCCQASAKAAGRFASRELHTAPEVSSIMIS